MNNEKKFHKFCKRAGAAILAATLLFTSVSADDFIVAANNTEVIDDIDFTDSLAEETEGQAEETPEEPAGDETVSSEETASETIPSETVQSETSTSEATVEEQTVSETVSEEITSTETASTESTVTEPLTVEETTLEETTTEEEVTTEETDTEEATLVGIEENQGYKVIFVNTHTNEQIKTEKEIYVESLEKLEDSVYPDLEGAVTEDNYGFAKWLKPVVSEEDKTITVGAKFGRMYTIKFDLNGGLGTVPADITAIEGKQYDLPNGEGLTKEGYKLDGWAISKNTTGRLQFRDMVGYKYPADGQVSTVEYKAEVMLYANWIKTEAAYITAKFYIRYSDNTVPSPYRSYSTKLYTSCVATIKDCAKIDGYVYAPAGISSAILEKVPDDASVKSALAKVGKTYDPAIHEVCWYVIKNENDGYHIDGIVKDKRKVSLLYDPNIKLQIIDQYLPNAKEQDIKVSNMPDNETKIKGSDFTVSGKQPEIEGFQFMGWYMNPECSTPAAGSFTGVEEDIVLYAKWEQIEYKVTYLNEDEKQVLATGTYALNSTVAEPEKPKKPATDNYCYKFVGWNLLKSNELPEAYKSYAAEGTKYAGLDENGKCQGNAVYIAQFEKIEKVTLTYLKNCDDKEVVNNIPESEKCIKNDKLKVSKKVPVREGYRFVGWNTQADGNGHSFKTNEDIEMPTDRVLYAQWEKDEEESSSIEESSSEEESSSVEESSSAEESSSVEESSAVEESSSVEESSAAEESSSVEESSAAEESSSVEESSAVEESSSVEESSAVEESSSVEESSAVEESSSVEESSAVVESSEAPESSETPRSSETPTPTPTPTPDSEPTPSPAPTPSATPAANNTTIVETAVPLAASPLALTTIMDDEVPLADTVTIEDEDTPLADTVTIEDEDTPLASMPDTGDNSTNPIPFAAAGVAALAAAFVVNKRTKKNE